MRHVLVLLLGCTWTVAATREISGDYEVIYSGTCTSNAGGELTTEADCRTGMAAIATLTTPTDWTTREVGMWGCGSDDCPASTQNPNNPNPTGGFPEYCWLDLMDAYMPLPMFNVGDNDPPGSCTTDRACICKVGMESPSSTP
jgi:hypothetical protein